MTYLTISVCTHAPRVVTPVHPHVLVTAPVSVVKVLITFLSRKIWASIAVIHGHAFIGPVVFSEAGAENQIKKHDSNWSSNHLSIMTFTTDLPSMSKGLFMLRRSCSYRSCSCCRRSSSRSLIILSCSRRLSYSIRNLSRSKNWRSIRSASRRSFSNCTSADVLEQSYW